MATVTGMTSDAIATLVNALVQTGAIDGSGNLTLTTHDGTIIDLGSVISSIPTASTSVAGIVELASSSDVTTGTDTSKAVTPAELASRTSAATTAVAGILKLATSAQVVAGTDNSSAVTASGLASLLGTTTIAGLLKLATTAQVTAGTDTTSAITPAELAGAVATLNSAIGGKQTSNANLTAIAGLVPATGDVIQYESGAWANRTYAQLAADLTNHWPLVINSLYNGTAYVGMQNTDIYVGSVDPATLGTIVNGSVWFDTTGT